VPGSCGPGEMVNSEGQTRLVEADVMLFFWGNSQGAAERHHNKLKERTREMDQWRQVAAQSLRRRSDLFSLSHMGLFFAHKNILDNYHKA
jgi:hypothetical protein